MELLQKFYLFFLEPFSKLTQSIETKTAYKFTQGICLLLFSSCYVWYSVVGMGRPLTLSMRMIVAIILIVALVFWGLEKNTRPLQWNKIVFYSWFLLGIIIFLMGFFTNQNLGYWLTGPVIAFGLPCYYMVYGKKEKYLTIFDLICKAAIICTIFYFFVCLGGEFFNSNTWTVNRYNGLTSDANKIGELCLASFCCLVYYILTNKIIDKWFKASVISIGIIIGQVYWTQSRTTIIAMIAIIMFYIVIIFKNALRGKSFKMFLHKVIPLILAFIVGIASIAIIDEVRNIHLGNPSFIDFAEASEGIEDGSSAGNKEEYRDFLPSEGMDLNSYSSGRLHIWEVYSRNFNFIGNDADAEVPISPEIQQRTAHNSFIEITYRSGYFAGAAYAIIMLISIIHIIKVAIRNNEINTDGDYFMAIVSIAYIIFTSLMPAYNPLTAIIFLLYVIVFPVLLEQKYIFK